MRRAEDDGRRQRLHAGHRSRLRQRFLGEGLRSFDDHQVLELLLFYAIPRRDTNELAHVLLKRYGSLAEVLDADPADLGRCEGVGDNAATLLALMPAVAERYLLDRTRRPRHQLKTTEQAAEFLLPFMATRTEEAFFVVCLDTQCRIIVAALVVEGAIDRAHVEPRAVVETALRHKAHSVILAHNHPTGTARPSTADHRVTRQLVEALGAIDIPVRDHIIVAGTETYSFARAGDLPTRAGRAP